MFIVSYSVSHVCFLSQFVYFFCNSLVLLDGCSTIVSHVSKGLKWKESFIDRWEGFQKHTAVNPLKFLCLQSTFE